jgi:hypothetical protein
MKKMMIIFALAVVSLAAASEKQTFKVESGKTVSLILKMNPGGGKLVIRAGSRTGEIEINCPSESRASAAQKGNEITLEGQSQPSTYTLLIPHTGIDLAIDINGKKWQVSQSPSRSAFYEFEIP